MTGQDASPERGRGRQALAALLIGVGLLWLLGALGLVSAAVLGALLTFWPLLLIGVGLDLLMRPRQALGLPFTLAALALIGLLALLPGAANRSPARTFSEQVGIAREAQVQLTLGSAPSVTYALPDGSDAPLIEARIRDRGDVRFGVAGGERKRVTLEKRGSAFGFGPPGHWEVALNPYLPLELLVAGGSGRVELDLSDLTLQRLSLDAGSGDVYLGLPSSEQRADVALELGSGATEVVVPQGADLNIQADTGSGDTSFRIAPGSYVALTLQSGSGNVDLALPQGSNVRLEVQGDSSGRLALPGGLERQSGEGDRGVWQTSGFTPGAGQVLITIVRRGSGGIRLH